MTFVSLSLTYFTPYDNIFFFWSFFCLFRATPVAYGGSQPRDQIGAASAGLLHSHSHVGSEPCLQPTSQLLVMLDPEPTERGQGSNLHPHG